MLPDARWRPFASATSHRILHVDHGGTTLLHKDLRDEALLPEATGCRPAAVADACREPAVYRELLAPAGIGPGLHASGPDWLVVEQVPGVELWQIGDLDRWAEVAAWLPGMHARLAGLARRARAARVLRHDRAFHQRWLRRASDRLGHHRGLLGAAHRAAVEHAEGLPQGLIHGELYPSNVLVASRGERLRVWPVDWEMAGVGPLLTDLACLVAGWEPAAQRELAGAYARAAGADADEVLAGLDVCLLLQSIQWLGWADRWEPPAEHRRAWLDDAVALANRVRVDQR
jgi:hypothetical protein